MFTWKPSEMENRRIGSWLKVGRRTKMLPRTPGCLSLVGEGCDDGRYLPSGEFREEMVEDGVAEG